jgi:hypothetical protein
MCRAPGPRNPAPAPLPPSCRRRVSFVGCCLASLVTGKGPYTLLCQHLADPLHNTVLQSISHMSS